MITRRPAAERGHANHGWLDSWHSFSFASYRDPRHMGFGPLRVINEDRVAGGAGFDTHGHKDMEIITYVLDGALEHKDSIGTGSIIRPGEVQLMTAGSGIRHSEYNHDKSAPVHLLQIWIEPDRMGVPPGYQQKTFPNAERRDRLRLIVSPDGAEESLHILQDARLYAATLGPGVKLAHALAPGRRAWLQVARGATALNGQALGAGDGAAIESETDLTIAAAQGGEVLLFDMA
ncbi:MAG: pirin family protein [Alphaproteobacteria bacterium]|nr:pirin family protein [Alphaproteobacteria bacterium]